MRRFTLLPLALALATPWGSTGAYAQPATCTGELRTCLVAEALATARACLALTVGRRLRSDDVLATLTDLFVAHGPPEHIRSDQGSEFIANVVKDWLSRIGVRTHYIEKASPWRTATTNPSTASSGTSCSTGRSSTPWQRPGF